MVSREWSGRKFNWIRKQLGLSKVELARQAEVCATADDKLKINARRGRRPGDRYPFL